jgi:hypothetical protein
MMALIEKLLALPESLTTPAQRAAWTAFAAIMPELPTSGNPPVIAPARVLSSGSHNNEGKEASSQLLRSYSPHHFRLPPLLAA